MVCRSCLGGDGDTGFMNLVVLGGCTVMYSSTESTTHSAIVLSGSHWEAWF